MTLGFLLAGRGKCHVTVALEKEVGNGVVSLRITTRGYTCFNGHLTGHAIRYSDGREIDGHAKGRSR